MTDLWSSLLRESSKRSNYPEGTVLFLGDSYCGKTKLVEQLCTHDSKDIHSQSEYVAKEILSYNFFEIDESFSNSDISSKIGIWSIGDKCFDHAIEMVINAVKQNKV
jgi:GTPase SAR1 family protein